MSGVSPNAAGAAPDHHDARRSPLHAVTSAAGATFTEFGGWEMPLRYTSDRAEHRAVREAAGLFDISHMAEFRITGPQAGAALDYALAGAFQTMAVGRAKYTLLLDERAGIVDDLIVYRLGADEYLVVANAANHDVDLTELRDRACAFDVAIADETEQTALLALQGPNAAVVLAAVEGLEPAGLAGAEPVPFDELRYYRCAAATFAGASALVARTGYTGEDGFELYVPAALAEQAWEAVVVAGASHGLVLCGLASRDTLRLEAGMPLYGHELSLDTLPDQVGLGRVVAAGKDSFVGREALLAARESGRAERLPVLVGLRGEGRRAARAGYGVLVDGSPVGHITSGVLSPTLGYPIAMALVDPAATHGAVDVDVRGKLQPMQVTDLPFYRRVQQR